MTIKVDLPGGGSDTISDTTSAAGALSHDYALAAGAADGTYKFTVLDGSNNELASKSVSVLTPGSACAANNPGSVQTDQPGYSAGETVQISGGGFNSQCAVQVRITKPGGATDSGGATTDFSGNFGFGYTLAADAATGSYTVDVLGANDTVLATATFQVEATAGALCSKLGTENLDTDKNSYYAGNTIHLSGGGYAHLCDVTIRITKPDGTVLNESTATATIGGAITATYAIPGGTDPGAYTVTTLGLAGVQLATTGFQVAQLGEAFIKTEIPTPRRASRST